MFYNMVGTRESKSRNQFIKYELYKALEATAEYDEHM